MDFSWLNDIWDRLSSVQDQPELWMVIAAWALSLGLIFTPLWSASRNVITVVHEGGHAFVGLLWGRRISGIKLHADTSGVTISSGKQWGLGAIFTTAAGYTAPAFLGLALQWLISEGRIFIGTALIGLLLFGVFISIRNFWGLIVTLPLLAVFYWVFSAAGPLQTFTLVFLATFLTLASIKPILELQKSRRSGNGEGSDADQLAKLTLIIPGIAWVAYFFLVSLAANLLTIWLQWSTLTA